MHIIVPFPITVEFGITTSGWIRVVSSNPLTINFSYNVLLIAGSPIAIQILISLAVNSFKISENFKTGIKTIITDDLGHRKSDSLDANILFSSSYIF